MTLFDIKRCKYCRLLQKLYKIAIFCCEKGEYLRIQKTIMKGFLGLLITQGNLPKFRCFGNVYFQKFRLKKI